MPGITASLSNWLSESPQWLQITARRRNLNQEASGKLGAIQIAVSIYFTTIATKVISS